MPPENNSFKEFTRDPAHLDISNLLPRRPTTGPDVPVVLWRLLRVVSLHKILGDETPTIAYFLGKNIGNMLAVKTPEDIHRQLTALKIGKLNFSVSSPNIAHLAIAECMTCDGITPPLGRPICQLEAGIVAGALENLYPDKKIIGDEIKCIGGLGDEVCLIECKII